MLSDYRDLLGSFLRRAIQRFASLPRLLKRIIFMTMDALLFVLSTLLAFYLRLGDWNYSFENFSSFFVPCFVMAALALVSHGVYNSLFRFVGAGMMRMLLNAYLIYALAVFAVFGIWGFDGVPRTLSVIQPLLFFAFIVGARTMVASTLLELLGRAVQVSPGDDALVYGAGESGQQLVRALRGERSMRIKGFLDDDRALIDHKIDGLRIYNPRDIKGALEKTGASLILLAMPSVSRRRRHEIVNHVSQFPVEVRSLPGLREMASGTVSIRDVRPVVIEDLLGRESVAPDDDLLKRTIVGKTVLVTGAGGSIGGELCRQIQRIGARRLLLLDISEFALYSIEADLRRSRSKLPNCNVESVPLLGSVTDPRRLQAIFAENEIDAVFHAAAYKHVPLVETNPFEAVRNNIVGTSNLSEISALHGVSDFIHISTDKAVRPTNIMGASKRGAEQIIQAMGKLHPQMRSSMVRFGNVLGSSGSVVPLFRNQIERGGPITLTHKDVTRFFMTIPEAANLVIQAGGLAEGGEVFVLDMGNPIRIADLAKTMVQLSGLSIRDDKHPDGDIAIVEVGLRPGEKLYEELLIGENPQNTAHPRIMKAHENHADWSTLQDWIGQFEACHDPEALSRLLKTLVPEFEHRRDDEGLA